MTNREVLKATLNTLEKALISDLSKDGLEDAISVIIAAIKLSTER